MISKSTLELSVIKARKLVPFRGDFDEFSDEEMLPPVKKRKTGNERGGESGGDSQMDDEPQLQEPQPNECQQDRPLSVQHPPEKPQSNTNQKEQLHSTNIRSRILALMNFCQLSLELASRNPTSLYFSSPRTSSLKPTRIKLRNLPQINSSEEYQHHSSSI